MLVAAVAAFGAACGGGDSESPSVVVDGSSTLGPFTARAAHDFQLREPGVDVDVGISRTSQGFDRFCAGELDIANASRPIDEDEAATCAEEGIEYVELQVANDAITIAIHKPILYDWVTCLTVDQLRRIWEPDSAITNWNQVDPSYPDVPLRLYGADEGSGTFGYFTFVINGERGASRTDYSATDDDNDTVEGVADDKGALGYFGFSYYQANRNRLNALAGRRRQRAASRPRWRRSRTARTSRSRGRSTSTSASGASRRAGRSASSCSTSCATRPRLPRTPSSCRSARSSSRGSASASPTRPSSFSPAFHQIFTRRPPERSRPAGRLAA